VENAFSLGNLVGYFDDLDAAKAAVEKKAKQELTGALAALEIEP
jgi:hypothetical protein